MEPHPVPQNVTSFQFKLVGDMTIKQFIYLAAGVMLAYLTFIFIAPLYPLVAWPVIVVSSLTGTAFAFLPFKGRPLEQWVKAFFIAIYSPTKRVWLKNGRIYKEDPLYKSRFVMYTTAANPIPYEEPIPSLQQTPQEMIIQPTAQAEQPAATQLPTPEELKKTVDLAKEAQDLKLKIIHAEKTLSDIKQAASKPTKIPVDYTHEANTIVSSLKNLVAHASEVRDKLDELTHEKDQQQSTTPPRVVRITPPPKLRQQLALTTFPNVINGVVRDRLGNYLEGVVAVIYDKEGLPVRALKTNKLGQFSGSTPLPNEVYKLELEKDNFNFDVLQMELTGDVLPPLIITAKEVTVS